MTIVLARKMRLSLALVLMMASGAYGYDGVTQVGETGEQIVAFVRQAHEKVGFRGAVFAAYKGKVIVAVAVGPRGGKNNEPLAVHSLFEIASCTKAFTAIAVMRLVEEGRLELDDSIAEHLPGIPDSCRAITVRHLLQHTSGIPGTNTEGYGKDLAKVLPTFLKGGPRTPPGEKYEYWNQGYALLSEIIARASRKSYTQYMREEIFKPCKMENSRFTGQRAPRKASVAIGASPQGNRSALDHPYGEYGFQYRGMGGMVTNLIDLWHWDRMLAKGELLHSESLQEMTRPDDVGHALGWKIKKLDSGAIVQGHTGSVRGFLASIERNPTDDSCLFVLANSDASAPFHFVLTGCQNLLEGKDPPVHATRLSDTLIAELVGVYHDKDGNGRTFRISRKDNNAKARLDWNGFTTHGYLGIADSGGNNDLMFGRMKTYDPANFNFAAKINVQRKGDDIASLVITFYQEGKAIHFNREED